MTRTELLETEAKRHDFQASMSEENKFAEDHKEAAKVLREIVELLRGNQCAK